MTAVDPAAEHPPAAHPAAPHTPAARRLPGVLWPRTLFGRLVLIFFLGLAAAHGLSFWLVYMERGMAARTMMADYLARDLASSVAMLERLPVAERAHWLPRLARRNYRLVLGAPPAGTPSQSRLARQLAPAVAGALGREVVALEARPAGAPSAAPFAAPSATPSPVEPPGSGAPTNPAGDADDGTGWREGTAVALRLQLALVDGTPLAVELAEPRMTVSTWVLAVLAAQLALLALLTWFAVRLATRPLARLAQAADLLAPGGAPRWLPETGSREVAQAAAAFNAMQRRIDGHLAERMRILAAVSHDLQTPITRMRLRAELLDDAALQAKLLADLDAMQALVGEGLAYARSAHGGAEAPCAVDLHALLDSLVCDYADAGQAVALAGLVQGQGITLQTRPQALRRVLTNLVDNALKFAGQADIAVQAGAAGRICIEVLDSGPGIPEDQLQAVLQPFYRIEGSRSRDTGGTGLGLAIADELARALGGELSLTHRKGGGLRARLWLPIGAPPDRRPSRSTAGARP